MWKLWKKKMKITLQLNSAWQSTFDRQTHTLGVRSSVWPSNLSSKELKCPLISLYWFPLKLFFFNTYHSKWDNWWNTSVTVRRKIIVSIITWKAFIFRDRAPSCFCRLGLFLSSCNLAFLTAFEYSKTHENWHSHQNWWKLQFSSKWACTWSTGSVAPLNAPHHLDRGAWSWNLVGTLCSS